MKKKLFKPQFYFFKLLNSDLNKHLQYTVFQKLQKYYLLKLYSFYFKGIQ